MAEKAEKAKKDKKVHLAFGKRSEPLAPPGSHKGAPSRHGVGRVGSEAPSLDYCSSCHRL